jgi:hypothetical protein
MKTRTTLTVLSLATVPAWAEGPGSPPPETGIMTPYNAQRDAAPDEYPAASVRRARCAGQHERVVLENGAGIPGPAPDSTMQAASPEMNSGQALARPSAALAGSRAPAGDPTWCEGAYRPDAGSNFGEFGPGR